LHAGLRTRAVVRGYRYEVGAGSARELLRDPSIDLFR